MTPQHKTWSPRAAARIAALLACTSVVAAAATTYSDAVLRDGPIAYWQFNDAVTVPVIDSAANLGSLGDTATGTYNGAIHPIPGALAAGGATGASTIGGTHVAIPYQEALNPAGPFTAEVWLKPGVTFTDGTLTCPISCGDFASPRGGWLIYQSSGGFNLRFYKKQGTAFSASITGGGTLVAGAWYHVVAVYDGSDAVLYVNGAEAARATGITYAPGTAGGFAVGMRADNSFGWNGSADEVAFYGSALTAEQIAAHYVTGANATPAKSYEQTILEDAPLGFWRLNEGAFIPPVAANSGTLGAAAAGAYRGGAINSTEAPKTEGFIGFDDTNTSLDLDGVNDYVSTLNGLMNSKPRFTISGWIRRGADQGARTGLWGQNDLVEFGYIANNTLQVWTDGGLDLTPNPFPNEVWSHLAVVADGSRVTLYTNGVEAVSRAHSLPADNNFSFNIGGGGVFDGGGNFFKGQIDEVALYDKALSAAQICNQYAAAVPTGPSLAAALVPVTTYAGATVDLPAAICGSPTLSYQWYRAGGAPVAGATGPSLVIPNAQVSDSGDYFIRVSNDYGSVDSDPVTVTVAPPAPPILETTPVAISRYAGFKAVFSVSASGTPPFSYAWQKDGKDIPGATGATLKIEPVTADSAGDYRVVVKNPIDTVTSPAAALTVITPAAGYESALTATRPAAYWRLGETEGDIAHDYAGGLDGTYNNVVLGGQGGLSGDQNMSAEFNGTDAYVSTPAQLNELKAFTLTGWIRRGGAQKNRTGLFGQNDLIEFGFIDDTTIEAYLASGDAIDIANPLADEAWGFIALRGDSTGVTLSVNGSILGNVAGPFSSFGSTGFQFNIGGGGIFDGTGNFFLGGIDEVAFHDRALSDDELCSLYLSGTATPLVTAISSPGIFFRDSGPAAPAKEGVSAGAGSVTDDTRGGVLEFNEAEGDQFVIPAVAAFNSNKGTLSLWVRTAGVSGGGNDGAILFDRRTSSGDVLVQNDDGTLFVQANGGPSFSTSAGISDDAWHHIAYVYDQAAGGSTTIYIDGANVGTKATVGSWSWPATQQIELGRSHDGYWKKFNGRMDDFRIYNRILTETEIASLITGDSASARVASDALQALFTFDAPGEGYVLSWPCGTLQTAASINADGTLTWTDVAGATPPYGIRGTDAQRFYRVRY